MCQIEPLSLFFRLEGCTRGDGGHVTYYVCLTLRIFSLFSFLTQKFSYVFFVKAQN